MTPVPAPELVRALLDTVLPGGDGWPPASAVAIDAAVAAPAAAAAALLPQGFADLPADRREAALREVEQVAPAAVDALVAAAYTAYYTAPAVTAVLEERCGYPQRPPQPLGYDLPPFDDGVLAVVRRRGPGWRPVT